MGKKGKKDKDDDKNKLADELSEDDGKENSKKWKKKGKNYADKDGNTAHHIRHKYTKTAKKVEKDPEVGDEDTGFKGR